LVLHMTSLVRHELKLERSKLKIFLAKITRQEFQRVFSRSLSIELTGRVRWVASDMNNVPMTSF
jgi:hypothetical protein